MAFNIVGRNLAKVMPGCLHILHGCGVNVGENFGQLFISGALGRGVEIANNKAGIIADCGFIFLYKLNAFNLTFIAKAEMGVHKNKALAVGNLLKNNPNAHSVAIVNFVPPLGFLLGGIRKPKITRFYGLKAIFAPKQGRRFQLAFGAIAVKYFVFFAVIFLQKGKPFGAAFLKTDNIGIPLFNRRFKAGGAFGNRVAVRLAAAKDVKAYNFKFHNNLPLNRFLAVNQFIKLFGGKARLGYKALLLGEAIIKPILVADAYNVANFVPIIIGVQAVGCGWGWL